MPKVGTPDLRGKSNKCDVCGQPAKNHHKKKGEPWRNFCNRCFAKYYLPEYHKEVRGEVS